MKKNKEVKTAALMAVLILGSTAWLSAEYVPGQSGGSMERSDRQQDKTRIETTRTEAAGTQSSILKINKASALIGTTVKNQQGEDLGKIHDLVIDFNADKVAYVVLATGTGVFSSQKLHAVPLRAFQPGADGTSLILNAEKDKVARDEGFDKNNWPTLGTTTFGAEPFWKDDQGSTGSQLQQQNQSDLNQTQQKDQNLDAGSRTPERGARENSAGSGAAHPQQGSGPGGTQP